MVAFTKKKVKHHVCLTFVFVLQLQFCAYDVANVVTKHGLMLFIRLSGTLKG